MSDRNGGNRGSGRERLAWGALRGGRGGVGVIVAFGGRPTVAGVAVGCLELVVGVVVDVMVYFLRVPEEGGFGNGLF